jgi:hypothetical protein
VCHIVYFAGIMWAVHKTKCKRDIQWLWPFKMNKLCGKEANSSTKVKYLG